MNWYKVVNHICRKYAHKYNLETYQVVGILVTLSAQKDWKTNIKQVSQFLQGKPLTGMYSGIQIVNCNKIRSGINPLDIWGKTSFKYRNFYGSILDPEDTKPICVDTHMINWYLANFKYSKLHKVNKASIFANKQNYTTIQNAIRNKAKELNVVPSHAQAILWINQRNNAF